MKRTAEAKFNHVFAGAFPIRLALRSDLHLARKVWHLLTGLAVAFIYLSGLSSSTAVVILGSILGFSLIVETARLRIPAFNERVLRLWGPFMRANEVNQPSALPHYLLATILTIGIFPRPVAVLSILYLACGDPIASLVGILYGHKSIRFASGKSLIGTLAGVVTCIVVGFIFLKSIEVPNSVILAISLIGGVAGGTAELLPLDLDDNLTIPVISGFVLWLAFMISGI